MLRKERYVLCISYARKLGEEIFEKIQLDMIKIYYFLSLVLEP